MGLTLQEPRVDVLMPTEPSKPTFRDIVREAVAAFGEKNAKTVTVIVDEVLKDTELTREVLANAARQAIREIGTREATRKAKEFGKTVKPSRGTAAIASAGGWTRGKSAGSLLATCSARSCRCGRKSLRTRRTVISRLRS